MPIYADQVLTPDDGPTSELMQRFAEPPLTRLPGSGEPVRRIITAPNLPPKYGTAAAKNQLAPADLAKHGVTRYQREGMGRYVKIAGDPAAPSVLMLS